jgi:cytochrome c peroxidase
VLGKLNDSASPSELAGEALFFGKALCSECHTPPYFTDNTMHDLELERFFSQKVINGLVADGDGPIKTFPLRGIKESPPYFHDGRLLTLEDTVEFFNIVLELHLTPTEKTDLLAYLLVL